LTNNSPQFHDLFQKGLLLHEQGKILEAQVQIEQALILSPDNFNALFLLAILTSQTKNYEKSLYLLNLAINLKPNEPQLYFAQGIVLAETQEYAKALICFNQVIKLNPNLPEAFYNRGIVLKKLEQIDLALISFKRAIELNPTYTQAHNNLGITLNDLKKFEEAITHFDQVINIDPTFSEAYNNRGISFKQLNKIEVALDSYNKAISLNPDYAQAHNNRGILLTELHLLDEALISFDHAIRLIPHFSEAFNNRGIALKELNDSLGAIDNYKKALEISPDYAQAYYNQGIAQYDLGQLNEAIESYNKAISITPHYPEAYSNLGIALQDIKHLDRALICYDKAIELDPSYPEAYWNKSLALLLQGKFKEGWELYEWRWQSKAISQIAGHRQFKEPLWLGHESLVNKTILVYFEQGLGDTIHFSRYVKLLSNLGAKVILEVQAPLFTLLQKLEGVALLVAQGSSLPQFDYQCPLMSLPLALDVTLNHLVAQTEYIKSDPTKVNYWQKKLGVKTKPRIGIVWRGSTNHSKDQIRSAKLEEFLPFLPPQFEYISLQKELSEIDKHLLEANPYIQNHTKALGDFSDTAALIDTLDLVIGVDTSVIHLAGALGKKTWLMLPYLPDWRWLLDRSDSPWYPSLKLYRQSTIGNWQSVFENINADLLNHH